jgi:hypothetical protein
VNVRRGLEFSSIKTVCCQPTNRRQPLFLQSKVFAWRYLTFSASVAGAIRQRATTTPWDRGCVSTLGQLKWVPTNWFPVLFDQVIGAAQRLMVMTPWISTGYIFNYHAMILRCPGTLHRPFHLVSFFLNNWIMFASDLREQYKIAQCHKIWSISFVMFWLLTPI